MMKKGNKAKNAIVSLGLSVAMLLGGCAGGTGEEGQRPLPRRHLLHRRRGKDLTQDHVIGKDVSAAVGEAQAVTLPQFLQTSEMAGVIPLQ